MNYMELSVIMAVYNNQTTVSAAIQSILNQTYRDFIFYIIDDFSSDKTVKILNAFALKDNRVKLICNSKHLGLTKSLNKALKLVKTPYIARMDADDFAYPSRFKKQLLFLKSHPKVGLVGTAVRLINSQGKNLGQKSFPIDHFHLRRLILHYCPFIHPTWMFKREILWEVGFYNENFSFSQDYELALRIITRFETANLPEVLLDYRVDSPQAISLKNLKIQEWLALRARFRALTNFGYSFLESYKLFKPLLSFLFPVAIKKIVYRKFYWTSLLIFSAVVLTGCQKTVAPSSLSSPFPSASELIATNSVSQANINVEIKRAEDYKSWHFYNNDKYRFKIRYPFYWYFYQRQLEPEIVTLRTIPEEKGDAPHGFCQVKTTRDKKNNLDNYPAILELKQQGRAPRSLTIAKMPALLFDRLGKDHDLFTVFVQKDNTILEFNFGGNHEVNRAFAKDICLQIIASLEFF